ncbi:MAG: OadG family protein [Lachnospiraceae bacterium]|nr:OadG family protein [Lachnospiraceae bacterium]
MACGSEEAPAGSAIDPQIEAYLMTYMEETVVPILYQTCMMGAIEDNADSEVVYNGLLDFQSALVDIGNYLGTNGCAIEYDEKEDIYIARVNIKGSDHDAVMELTAKLVSSQNGIGTLFNSISTNVNYTFGEKMEKAALNTLLGMGTVFVVLILISVIIALFGFIPKLTAKKKETKPQEEKQSNVVAQIIEKEELSDDLELVAVISAAIAAYEGSGSTDGFVVRSIRKAYKK